MTTAYSRDAFPALTEIQRHQKPAEPCDRGERRAATRPPSRPGWPSRATGERCAPRRRRRSPASRTPQLTGGALVLMQDLVDVVGVVLAGAEAIDGLGHALDEVAEARLVVGGDQRAISLPLTLRSHAAHRPIYEATARSTTLSRARTRARTGTAFPPGASALNPDDAAAAGAGNGTETGAPTTRTSICGSQDRLFSRGRRARAILAPRSPLVGVALLRVALERAQACASLRQPAVHCRVGGGR
jgi:hypothetical protein